MTNGAEKEAVTRTKKRGKKFPERATKLLLVKINDQSNVWISWHVWTPTTDKSVFELNIAFFP